MAIVTSLIPLQGYNKIHIQSKYSVIRWKLKPGQVVIVNLFQQRILLYSPSRQMTLYILYLKLQQFQVKVPEFDKHLKKAGRHIGQNIVVITKMKTIVQKPLMIKRKHVFII